MSAKMFYDDGEYERYKGFRILAVDGSVVTLPNSTDIRNEFNPMTVKCQIDTFKKEVVQARVSCLFDVLNNIAVDASITNKNKSQENDLVAYDERTLAVEHLKYANKDDLVIMDRGYPSYELFAKAYKKKNHQITNMFKRSIRQYHSTSLDPIGKTSQGLIKIFINRLLLPLILYS